MNRKSVVNMLLVLGVAAAVCPVAWGEEEVENL